MKIFYIISNKRYSGKTYLSSHLIASLLNLNKKVCYYKPFVMDIIDNKLFDIDYIKNITNLNASDIFVSYATNGNISPLHSIDIQIDERDIIDLIDENKEIYEYMVLESLCLYEPIKENYNFMDLIFDIEKYNQVYMIPILEYDSNIIHSSLEQVELFHTRGFKISFIVINIKNDIIISYDVLNYIRKQIDPIKIYIINYMSEKNKINYIKYPDIIKELNI